MPGVRLTLLLLTVLLGALHTCAQSVQPIIMEYKTKAEGKFSLVNNTLEPMIVVLEPKSFSIDSEGHGTFRRLDENIHVELSAMSVRLQPAETRYIFYKATADQAPAWFTIYSSFTPMRRSSSISVRIELPHTVYLYGARPLQQADVHLSEATYSAATHKIVCTLSNTGTDLGRVQEVAAAGPHGGSASLSGFPLLPGATRHVELEWKEATPPTTLTLHFEHFTLKPPLESRSEPEPASKQLSPSSQSPMPPRPGVQ